MKIVRIESCDQSHSTYEENSKLYIDWCKNLDELVLKEFGLDWNKDVDAEFVLGGDGPWEMTMYEGALYLKSTKDVFFSLFNSLASTTDNPEVLCSCGNTAFTLRYGSFEILARCIKCGNEQTVYEG